MSNRFSWPNAGCSFAHTIKFQTHERKKYVGGNFNHTGFGHFCFLRDFFHHSSAVDHDVRIARGNKRPPLHTASGGRYHAYGWYFLAIDKNQTIEITVRF